MYEIEGIANERPELFPFSGLRILGSLQLSVGILVFCVGISDLVWTMVNYESDQAKFGSKYDNIVTLTIIASPMWCGLWFCLTGVLGTCIAIDKISHLRFFKTAFMVFNVLCCSLFGLVCIILNGYISVQRHTLSPSSYQWLLSLVICFLGMCDLVISVVSAAVTCCCSPLKSSKVHVLIDTQDIRAVDANNQSQQLAGLAVTPERSNSRNTQMTDIDVDIANSPRTEPNIHNHQLKDLNIIQKRTAPEQEHFETSKAWGEPLADPSYAKLRKWALPH